MTTSKPVYLGGSPRGPDPHASRPALWRVWATPVGGVNEVRMGRAQIARKFAEGFGANEHAGRRIQHAVFSVEFLNCCSAARRVALTKDFLKVAAEQFVDTVGHRVSR
jgi:hypothetical protein